MQSKVSLFREQTEIHDHYHHHFKLNIEQCCVSGSNENEPELRLCYQETRKKELRWKANGENDK